MDPVKAKLITRYEADNVKAFPHAAMIARCFYPGTLEEIRHRLRSEKDPFAKKCLDAMDRNSKLSMRLGLSMLRKAINMDYTSCLQMEVDVASNLLARNPDTFEAGVQGVIMKPKKQGEKLHDKPDYPLAAEYIKDVESYFDPQPWAKNVIIDTVKYALLPTKMYYERFPDVVRLWINEESTFQPEVREQYDWAAKQALRGLGVDVRDGALTMKSAREHLWAKISKERREEIETERMLHLFNDTKLSEEYFSKVDKEYEKLVNGKGFQGKID